MEGLDKEKSSRQGWAGWAPFGTVGWGLWCQAWLAVDSLSAPLDGGCSDERLILGCKEALGRELQSPPVIPALSNY